MTYNVLMGMLNPTQSLTHSLTHSFTHAGQKFNILTMKVRLLLRYTTEQISRKKAMSLRVIDNHEKAATDASTLSIMDTNTEQCCYSCIYCGTILLQNISANVMLAKIT